MELFSDEKRLLEGLAANDKQAIERIYRDNFHMIQAMVVNNTGSNDDAADIFQETMIVLFEKSKTEGFELTCQLKTFMYSISRRLWLKKLQTQNRLYSPAEPTEEVVAVEEDLEFHEKRHREFQVMEGALERLGEPCKSLLEAYYLQKKDMNQIAETFGYTNSDNAKTQKYKCLIRLKKLFFQHYKSI